MSVARVNGAPGSSVHPAPSILLEGWTSCKIFKNRGEAWQDLRFSRGVAGKEGVTFFMGGVQCLDKNKLKSGIFNNKKRL